ncbi:MAG: O-antigen ligase family protein, partial [Candidatus Omnitrophota bacterium]
PIGHAGASVCFVLLALCFVIRKAIHPDFSFLKKTEHLWLLLFFVFCALSLVNSGPYLQKSLWALFLKWGKYLLVFLFFRETLTSPMKLKRVGWAILITAAIIGIDGLVQFFRGTDLFYNGPAFRGQYSRILSATFKNPNDLASYLGLVIGVSLAMLVTATTQKVRWIFGALTISLGACLVLTYSRGAWFGVFFGLLLMMLISRKWRVFLLVLGLLGITFSLIPNLLARALSGISLTKGLQPAFFAARDEYSEVGFQLILENPFLGKGLGTFMDYCGQRSSTLVADYAHNGYLQIWAESGIFSLLAFLLFVGTLLGKGVRSFKRGGDPLLLGLICGIFAFLVHSSVDTQFYSVAQSYLLWSMLGILAAATQNAFVPMPQEATQKQTYSVLGSLFKQYREASINRRGKSLAEKVEKNIFYLNKKVLASLGLAFMILLGVVITRFFENLAQVEAYSPTMVQAPTHSVSEDFDKEASVKNYANLGRAGIDAGEGAVIEKPIVSTPVTSVRPTAVRSADPAKSFAVRPVTTSRPIPRAYVNPTSVDPLSLRNKADAALQKAGVKTKEEAMDVSLALWEKRRRIYFS